METVSEKADSRENPQQLEKQILAPPSPLPVSTHPCRRIQQFRAEIHKQRTEEHVQTPDEGEVELDLNPYTPRFPHDGSEVAEDYKNGRDDGSSRRRQKFNSQLVIGREQSQRQC